MFGKGYSMVLVGVIANGVTYKLNGTDPFGEEIYKVEFDGEDYIVTTYGSNHQYIIPKSLGIAINEKR